MWKSLIFPTLFNATNRAKGTVRPYRSKVIIKPFWNPHRICWSGYVGVNLHRHVTDEHVTNDAEGLLTQVKTGSVSVWHC
mmetsp:Transcript_27911/g.28323  ORF Transcript_27911/g.28323 Transcript_27911/m.28323 type:complete len:80 (+) Transcript_27911:521-760(+)